MRLWDPATGKAVRRLPAHPTQEHALVFSPDGRWLAAGGEESTARIFEVASGREVASFVV
ncbi:WD40 repeat domain-containing protein, partial [Salmonella enterica]|uniref:WD40 repeat domain-containing protein n=1 Tax=Salmonella enterica TaxID=28901 RepID=UPI003D28B4B1